MGIKMVLRAIEKQQVVDKVQIVCRMVLSRHLKLQI